MTDGRAGLGKDGLNFRQCPTGATRQADPRAENASPRMGRRPSRPPPKTRPRRPKTDATARPLRAAPRRISRPGRIGATGRRRLRINRPPGPDRQPEVVSAVRPANAFAPEGTSSPLQTRFPNALISDRSISPPPTQALRQGVPVGVFKLTWRPITGIDPGRRAEAPRPMPRSPHPPARVRRKRP